MRRHTYSYSTESQTNAMRHYRKDPPQPSDFANKAIAAIIACLGIIGCLVTLYLLYVGCSAGIQWLFDLFNANQ